VTGKAPEEKEEKSIMNTPLIKTSELVHSQHTLFSRAEGAVLLAAAIVFYHVYGGNWFLFALLLLAPDLSAIGYLLRSRFAALAYNLAHTLVFPALLAGYGIFGGNTLLIALACIWFAHIGMDRLVGYGFRESSTEEKYGTQSK
jgi:hypothetical protein